MEIIHVSNTKCESTLKRASYFTQYKLFHLKIWANSRNSTYSTKLSTFYFGCFHNLRSLYNQYDNIVEEGYVVNCNWVQYKFNCNIVISLYAKSFPSVDDLCRGWLSCDFPRTMIALCLEIGCKDLIYWKLLYKI